MKNHPRVDYILTMYASLQYSFSACFNMLAFYVTEQEAMNLLIKAKKDLQKKPI